ncbi:SDR family oxidoreductase [Gordonia humi]|uniref:NAD(P)-dependent dehydrogenase (Short-subunit alcohol dehydrogenase family) n=1 Tax=Gordonia humi TaxID=686429 RepID=A0A840ERH5_9ACTN|nr:SDR family oxidoreductase [Gordonia humi]MBB4135445.1 NAD(P)-dependent dehydrogenase (short-subunit alcohol dehydrogenase family) [Gordonia humi]
MTSDSAVRRIVVTGAAAGIGRAIATKAAAEGAKVMVNDLDADAVHALAHEIGAIAAPGDAASPEGADGLVAIANEWLGGVDVWFGNAGIDRGRGLAASEDDWTDSWEVNVMAHVRAARALVPQWVAQGGGRYVVTASAAGMLTMLGAPAYSTTKHGVIGFAEWLSASYRHKGVVVQAICPQGVRTRIYEESGDLKEVLSHDAVLEPSDIADAAWAALGNEDFYILPHERVGDYYLARATAPDRWLTGMNRIQQSLEKR